ncbi:MAG: M61 family peptidase [Cytophagaceae bacterium]|jgi:predicted metalloprotease with PDZ domain|nr:M61 family peptidase [Cytophagaceae bacterium]
MKYLVSYQEPLKGFIHIRLETFAEGEFVLNLPAWRPGRYELQQYAAYIYDFQALDPLDGSALRWKKIGRNQWKVFTSSPRLLHIEWKYYARQLDAGGSWVDDDLFYLNPVNCLMYKEGQENSPWSMELDLPDHFTIASGLSFENRQCHGHQFFELADSPILAAPQLAHASYTVGHSQHHLWAYGVSQLPESMVQDFQRFTESQLQLMEDFPEPHYHYLLLLLPRPHYHGVEHRHSTVITLGPAEQVIHGKLYQELLGICSHELFHAWNILKIRPTELLPYRYQEENYFETGFVAEGFTTYYGDLFLRRASLISDETWYAEIETHLKRHFENYGYEHASLLESSFDLWVDGYSQPAPHKKVSIYTKGCLAALCLDLKIRRCSSNRRSLDSVMRKLWKDFGRIKKGYSYSDIVWLVSEAAGMDLSQYLHTLMATRTDLRAELEEAWEYVGIKMVPDPNQAYLESEYGIRFKPASEGMWIDNLAPHSPASGLMMRGDEVVHYEKKEDHLFLVVLRRNQEFQIDLPKGSGYFPSYKLMELESAQASQRANRRLWLEEHVV